jgi:hypothetical protein
MTKVVTSLQTSQEVVPRDINSVTRQVNRHEGSNAHRAGRWREIINSLHGRLEIPDLVRVYQKFPEVPMISISNTQQQPLHWLNWQVTVYHGLPEGLN